MGIDWFTFFAQIVNFLILMGLLWRFLYRPIMKAMSEREQRIADRLEAAEAKKREADREARSYREKSDDLENQRDQLLAKAKKDAEQQRKHRLDEIRNEIEDRKARWLESIEEEKAAFFRELHRRLDRQLSSTLGRILKDLADENLEARVVETFVRRLEKTEALEGLNDLLQESDRTIEVVTAFDLDRDHRERIASAVKTKLSDGLEVTFARSEDLVCGVELRTNGQKVGWSVNTYLQDLEADLDQTFHDQAEQARTHQRPDRNEPEDTEGEHQPATEAEAAHEHDKDAE